MGDSTLAANALYDDRLSARHLSESPRPSGHCPGCPCQIRARCPLIAQGVIGSRDAGCGHARRYSGLAHDTVK